MTRGRQIGNLVGVTAPFVGCLAAIVLLWNEVVNWTDLALLGSAYVLTAIGVTVGYHRLLTHRAFITYKPVEYVLAGLGSMSLQGSVIDWVADHRKHHAHTDEEGDPHSPHVGHGSGVSGLWYAHTGWLFRSHGQAEHRRYAKDLDEDRGMRLLSERYHVWVILSLGIPFALGFWLHGNFAGGVRGLVWGGLVRVFFLHHVTWSINSVCHFFGRRRFALEDHSTNVAWLALPSLGEAWHHNHHAFPRSANHGLRWWEIDLSAWVIRGLELVGLAWNVVRISPERQASKVAARTVPLEPV